MRQEYGSLIRARRNALGMNQARLAEELGVSRNAVAGWETGHSRPDLAMLPALCETLGITLEAFFGTEKPRGEEEHRLLKLFFSLEERDREALFWQIEALAEGRRRQTAECREKLRIVPEENEIPLPRYVTVYANELDAAAGVSAGLAEARGEMIYLLADAETEAADEIITVNGQSMEPTFLDGEQVLVRHTERLRPGEIGIFLADGEGYIKEYQPDGLHSHNPAYGVMRFHEGQSVRCIGKVIAKLKPEQIPNGKQLKQIEEAETARERGNGE